MGKYLDIQTKVFSIFGSDTWKAEAITTIPQDMIARDVEGDFIRVTILPGSPGVNRVSIAGVCIVDIYTAAGKGPTQYHTIADKLDTYLANSTVGIGATSVQFGSSALVSKGIDKDNSALTRAQYTIPFNFFGVL
jgi:hypothetical protein